MVPLPPIAAQTSSGVAVTGSISKSKIQESESVSFWITIKNQSGATIKSVRLAQYPDSDYTLRVVLWVDGPSVALKAGDELVRELPAGQTYTVWGELKPIPKRSHPPEKVTVILGWNNNESFSAAVLGENTVQDWWDHALDSWLSGAVKFLGVPALLVALVGFGVNFLTQRRAMVAETWKLMLPISHNYTMKHYMAISAAADGARDACDKSDERAAFFHVLSLLKRVALAQEKIGGVYFKNRTGERLVEGCLHTFQDEFLGEETSPFRLKMRLLSKRLGPKWQLEDFEDKFLSGRSVADPDFKELFNQFQARMKEARTKKMTNQEAPHPFLYLKAFCAILDFEANRPYEFWYKQKAKLETTQEVAKLLRRMAEEKEGKGAKRYFQDLKIIPPERTEKAAEMSPSTPASPRSGDTSAIDHETS